ncbi:MAG TPA: transcription-repair coupling factor [Ignavibacteria bacterium]|nr:transcription-repair coupling factor [Bacteroidota bacterium]HRI85408.1 transcription-repair coupling factor [Ignavibacteria bacterium]HRK00248.1 transcription-repair coupling factor [Ignavibacteria bacterium]
MNEQINKIRDSIFKTSSFKKIPEVMSKLSGKVLFKGVHGSLISFVINYLYSNFSRKIIFVTHDPERLAKVKDDTEFILNTGNITAYSGQSADSDPVSNLLMNLTGNDEFIIFLNHKGLEDRTISKEIFLTSITEIKAGDQYSFNKFKDLLIEYKYEKKDFVETEGDFSVRGGIVDIFSESNETPVRLEFFGDKIESIREFDLNSQRSVRDINSVKIGMNLSADEESENLMTENITDYFPEDALIIIDEPEITLNEIKDDKIISLINRHKQIQITSITVTESPDNSDESEINFRSKQQPDFHSNLKMLYQNLCQNIEKGYRTFIMTSDERQAERIKELIEDFEDDSVLEQDNIIHNDETEVSGDEINDTKNISIKNKFTVIPESFHFGFVFEEAAILIYTEHQIFGRYFRQIKKRKQKFKGLTFSELKELTYGDYIVHRDFGIGVYSGLKKITVGNSNQEVAVLSYHGNDKLFLNLNHINLIKKYSGSEGHVPVLTKLGGGDWDKLKARTKKQVKDIARDLILLYAKRKSETGYKFSGDTHWQKELEANFMYEDTPDQYSATLDTKTDMESENPMDRLICGDVGFGKTEVAVRAAFKAVLENKQVAVLVPTTILAVQHYNTFRDRLASFAVDVENISRLKSGREQKEILKKLEEGKLNILIGTHRILSKDIIFKDLGLLIIDEEQRFGVKAKEKLRSIKPNVDTLTLTATPIPRTLNFSLLGARDLSIINTPPKNRKPIITEIIKLDWKIISGIIRNELNRNGQVYFVNDKIKNLFQLGDLIKTYVPEAKTGIAHGQMEGKELEEIVVKFIEKKLNVLLCTKIIESGLDIPNVNTIIINNADKFGLAELYQLRGRVGRSDIQAYSYLIVPPEGKLTKTAIKRLQAIEEFTDLGSGFNLAMRDMEIRGVGNLLGKAQSGFVQDMGFDMYISTIEEAVLELKENEFKDLFRNEASLKKINESIEKKLEDKQTIIESDVNALIPNVFIENDTERLNIYRRLYEINDHEELRKISIELKDRFGEYLDDVENLIKIIDLKISATKLGLEKIEIRDKKLYIHFPVEKEHPVFESEFYKNLIEKISGDRERSFNISPVRDKLIIEKIFKVTDDRNRLKESAEVLKNI